MLSVVRRVAPFLLLGPLTGPLAAGLVFCLRAHRPVMAVIYGVGILEVWFGLPTILGRELSYLRQLIW
jgi:hypothetical protein